MNKTKEEILIWLKNQTRIYGLTQLERMTTRNIAAQLNLSRTLVSQYLNELCKENACVKISSRPVYYLARQELETKYQVTLTDEEYFNVADLVQALSRKPFPARNFENVVGADGSLAGCIAQLKSAMQYPSGLAVLLEGERGSGRRFLAQSAFEFLTDQHLNSAAARFVRWSVSAEMTPERQLAELFGEEQEGTVRSGLIEKAGEGVVYLTEADQLSAECQLKLAELIRSGTYTRARQTQPVLTNNARFILSLASRSAQALQPELLLSIPVHCQVPAFSRRPVQEREELVIQLLLKEQRKLNREIKMSARLFGALCADLPGLNLAELNNGLKTMCAAAYSQHPQEPVIVLKAMDLPPELLGRLPLSQVRKPSESTPLPIEQFRRQDGSDQILKLFDHLLESHRHYYNEHRVFAQFLEQGLTRMREYYDTIIFSTKEEDSRLVVIEAQIRRELETLDLDQRLTLPPNCSFVLARMTCALARIHSSLAVWESQRQEAIQGCLNTLRQQLPEATALAESLTEKICGSLELRSQPLNTIFLTLNIRFYNQEPIRRQNCGIIISHGYSTASSIADAANQLLGKRIFDALDMPLDTEVGEIEKKLNEFIRFHSYLRSMILLVDMGSLEGIAEHLDCPMEVGVINNISTGLALDIGMRLSRCEPLETILKSACESYQCRYRILARKQKERAILFTSDISVKISGKLAELFARSLPRPLNIRFIEADYATLQSPQERQVLFDRYEVLILIGPLGFHPENVNTMALEDIVSFRSMEPLNQALEGELDAAELELFQQQLLKNFSLQSLMENLTILNPARLLDCVYEAVSALQRQMNRRFQSRTLVGIYIHVSFLIERLVTRTAIESLADLTPFVQTHRDFIEQVNASFAPLLKNYNVTVPIDEISYLYDYIENDRQDPSGV